MIKLPIYDDNINAIISELLTINPNIEIDYSFNYDGIAGILLESDMELDKHHLSIKDTFVKPDGMIHELLHIKYLHELKYKWAETFVKDSNNPQIQFYICFSSMKDHFRIHNYLVQMGYIGEEDCWIDYINGNTSDDNYMCLYSLCNCINESPTFFKKYQKRIEKKTPKTLKMAKLIMAGHSEKLFNDEKIFLQSVRTKIKKLCKIVDGLDIAYACSLKLIYFFNEQKMKNDWKQSIDYKIYEMNGERVIGLFPKNDPVPFSIYEDSDQMRRILSKNESLSRFLKTIKCYYS